MDKTIGVTMGLDLGDRRSSYSVVDQATAATLDEGSVATTQPALAALFAAWPAARVVCEVGSHSAWVSRLGAEHCAEVLVANARDLRFIYGNRRKSDKVDAHALARVGRMDPELLHPVRHRAESAQRDLMQIRARDGLVRSRTKLVNALRGLVKPLGLRVKKQAAKSVGAGSLRGMPPEVCEALLPLVASIEELTVQIRAYDRRLERMARERYPETAVLTQVNGVGDLTALAFVLTVEDPARVKTSRDAGALLGLVPRRDQSGTSDPQLGITKTGDRALRSLLVQCAHHILGPFGEDSTLRRCGHHLAARGGKAAKKKAAIAVARKLAVLLHRLWATGEVYEPLRNARGA